jgi:glucosamine--fructose-6-phosphate aminotransferase (isomerizing)
VLARIGARLREDPPEAVVTCARGSSDHAATYGKYLIETMTGVITASAALSVASVFRAQSRAAPRLCIAVSQSGRSPDLLETVAAQRDAGAFVVALVNQPGSPLAELADEVLELQAGREQSVAATKSYIVSLAALAALTAAWTGGRVLEEAIGGLPELLQRAFEADWSPAIPILADASSLFVIGRGYTFGIAQEAALKLKETCGLHAESFSSAEVKHGPMAIVGPGFPLIAFAGSDAAGDDVRETVRLFRERGARAAIADARGGDGELPTLTAHPVLEPILMIQAFYRFADGLAIARGYNPDAPPFLEKVTKTR